MLQAIKSKKAVTACALHEEIKLRAFVDAESRVPVDLLQKFQGREQALAEALRHVLPGRRPIAAVYSDAHGSELLLRVSISDVNYLHEMRNSLLAGKTINAVQDALCAAMEGEPAPHIEIDLTHFARKYEDSVLSLENLTPHQQE